MVRDVDHSVTLLPRVSYLAYLVYMCDVCVDLKSFQFHPPGPVVPVSLVKGESGGTTGRTLQCGDSDSRPLTHGREYSGPPTRRIPTTETREVRSQRARPSRGTPGEGIRVTHPETPGTG